MIRLENTTYTTQSEAEAHHLCREGWVVTLIGRDADSDSFLMRRLRPETDADSEKIFAIAGELSANELVMMGRVQTVYLPARAKELAAEGHVCTSVHYIAADGSAAAWTMAPLKVYEI